MLKLPSKIQLNDDFIKISKIALCNLCMGGFIIAICYFLEIDTTFMNKDSQALPPSALSIFFNNLKVSLVYAVPYIGSLYYIGGFIIIYVTIGVYIISFGMTDAILRLVHMPLEVFALSIPLFISIQFKQLDWRKIIKIFAFSSILLLISAYIEFYMSRGI